MKNSKVTISHSEFKKLQKKLKKLEDKPQATMKIRHLLLDATEVNLEEDATAEVEVKKIILQIAGDFDSDPATLEDELDLKENLLFADDEFALLAKRLNKLVKKFKRSASVSSDDVDELETVGDTVEMVNDKIE